MFLIGRIEPLLPSFVLWKGLEHKRRKTHFLFCIIGGYSKFSNSWTLLQLTRGIVGINIYRCLWWAGAIYEERTANFNFVLNYSENNVVCLSMSCSTSLGVGIPLLKFVAPSAVEQDVERKLRIFVFVFFEIERIIFISAHVVLTYSK